MSASSVDIETATYTDGEIARLTAEKKTSTVPADESVAEIAETDSTGTALQTGGDAEAASGTTETGETTLMIRHEGAAGTLLTQGPVAEAMVILEHTLAKTT